MQKAGKNSGMNIRKTKPEKCLLCSNNADSRGLCSSHRKRFMDKKRSFATQEEADAFEARCIELGVLLPLAKAGRKPVVDDPFAKIAEEMGQYEIDDSRIVSEQKRVTAKKASRARSTKKKAGG